MVDLKSMKNISKYGMCDVELNYDFYFQYLLDKLNSLFIWENLDETINVSALNAYLFLNGRTGFINKDGKLYCTFGNWGGEPNEYYEPTRWIYANPVLGSGEPLIDKECVVMFNTDVDRNPFIRSSGLYNLINQTATLLADNIVSINVAQINSRVQVMFTADSPSLRNSAELALKSLYLGKPYQVVEQDTIEAVKANPIQPPKGTLTELVELHQYLMAQFYNAIGIKMNGVMKKERLITDEINSIDSYLKVSLDTMLKSRQEALDKINSLFGKDFKVRINPDLIQEEEVIKDEVLDNNGTIEEKIE